MAQLTCIICNKTHEWRRQFAEEDVPKTCLECARNYSSIEHNLNSMRDSLLRLRDLEYAKDLSIKMKKELDKNIESRDIVPSYAWW